MRNKHLPSQKPRDAPPHFADECTGSWRVVPSDKTNVLLVCSACGASHLTGSQRVIEDALSENWKGYLLETLSNSGVYHLNRKA